MTDDALSIGMLVFPGMTNLDFAGPYEVFAKMPGATVRLLWHTTEPIVSDAGLKVIPDQRLAACGALDLLFVPGGPGQVPLMDDVALLAFLADRGAAARWVTSVCTGSLLLGAAGLLRRYRAATHWTAMEQLALFGAIPTAERVVVDRNRVTGGGVTAGIDFGLRLAAIIQGDDYARRVELGLEYAPAPPFGCGHPDIAPAALVADLRARGAGRAAERLAASERAAALLQSSPLPPAGGAARVSERGGAGRHRVASSVPTPSLRATPAASGRGEGAPTKLRLPFISQNVT